MRQITFVVCLAVAGCQCQSKGIQQNHGTIQIDTNPLDFGPVTEFTDAGRPIVVRNLGNAALTLIGVVIESDGGSSEFTVMGMPDTIGVGMEQPIDIDFSPRGPGEDFAVAVITSDDPEHEEVRVTLHGGPIWPALDFDPDGGFLSFKPTSMALTSKYAVLRSVGGSSLTVTSVGVSPTGNPDFSVVRPALPATLKPGEVLPVQVDYAKSPRTEEGLMSVNSDDADAGRRFLRLLPDPAHACADGIDNDLDGLSDFPDDPGCSNAVDDDELNDPECVEGAMRQCGSAIGACRPGVQLCHLGAFYPCDGGTKPMGESCNGLDDNCDGVTDEGITEICTINGCMGARLCIPDAGVVGGSYGMCMPVATMQETCNGRDDNCNGSVDEGIVESCTINGCLGTRICIPGGDGGYTACAPANPATEICNGVDDNCDGTVDNVQPSLQTCGVGVCARTVPACVDGGVPTCVPGTGGNEICNGIDDNCDGVTDNMIAPLSCGSTGQCVNMVAACLADGGMNVCVPNPPSAEICDNVDNDCNTRVDDQADGGALTRTCYGGAAGTLNVGVCRGGTNTCTTGSWSSTCAGEITPSAETCNNLDDNCNMAIDEQPDGGPIRAACYDAGIASTRGVGQCTDGLSTCSSGAFGSCVGQVGPTAEVCDNVDNNCNGSKDEGLTRHCYTGPSNTEDAGICRGGNESCSNGTWGPTCVGQVLPAASETCGNSLDDNCNKQVDEGCDGGTCSPNGTWTKDGGTIRYTCCSGLVSFNISSFFFSFNGQNIDSSPSNPGTMLGTATTCPSGTFSNQVSISGGCTETYRLSGTFTSANTWNGTFQATFSGPDCDCFGGLLGTPCVNQAWNFIGYR